MIEGPDWLLLLNRDGVVEAVDGGAPSTWISRRIEECTGLPEQVCAAARTVVRQLVEPCGSAPMHRVRMPSEHPGSPSFTLLAIEAIFIRPAEVALEPLVRRTIEPLRRQAESAGISLEIDSAADLPAQLSVDADKIAWAITTLVGNALRYVRRGSRTMPGGRIGIRLARSLAQRMVSITVEDDGPGIRADVQSWLLTPDPATGKATGVSLRLVHDVVAAHGGGMVLKSSTTPEERGTAVTLWLPAGG